MYELVKKYIGIPYKLHGRTFEGLDCYGFPILFEKELGHEMYDLYRDYTDNNEKDLDNNIHNIVYANKLKKTEIPIFGDILLFYDRKGRVCHMGVYLKNNDFIHCDCEGVRVSNLSKYKLKSEAYTWLN